jgi:hypothetical protein
MADRVDVAVTRTKLTGVAQPEQTEGVVADGHMFRNDGRVMVEVENIDADAARIITFQTPGNLHGEPVPEHTVSVPKASVVLIGPFAPMTFNRLDHKVYIDYPAGNEADLLIRLTALA